MGHFGRGPFARLGRDARTATAAFLCRKSSPTTAGFCVQRVHTGCNTSANEVYRCLKPAASGQPVPLSHPHLVKHGETTPQISFREYEFRRKALMDTLPQGALVVSTAAPVKYMSSKIFYKFRQLSDFWYLTGFEEPDSAFILQKDSSPKGYRMIFFSSGKNLDKEKWEGARTSFEDVVTHFRADDALHISSFPSSLKSLSSSLSSEVYIDIPTSFSRRVRAPAQNTIMKYLTSSPLSRSGWDAIGELIGTCRKKPLAPEVAKLRAKKSKAEQIIMRAAADISGRAHTKTMLYTCPGMSEHMVASHFEYMCTVSGAQRLAYVPVIASGPNSLIIHYTSNNQIIQAGEMILMDAGANEELLPYFSGYASDITRTFPASGKFSSAQALLYSAVLKVQKHLITLCSESTGMSLHDLHQASCEALKVELNKIGFNLHGIVGARSLEQILYPHYVGHPIGIDLHESAYLDRTNLLKEGMVITVEPGIYVPPLPDFPAEFHNIGIRIEDEVLIGKTHPTILSVSAPKEIADVESVCQGLLDLGQI